ncbi:uncharacterized protein MICPUCDRAFT_54005 [Micromonas pusilla CCMP1545]|uniref:Predicted protein n=1 Tax=Micromonas pusilla (strain CCMP1545) TaxID=564608 RepID=C1N898_MICPC|nr:uncharacterized protein MICPUCDRAFT_54005 [Micromonas pusilla CCMP1545]EEH51853.1 predicted protein [Micromonas pusilla CCMP1545]|eukprot:XP_003064231.1 predicted protein [Micromonas pusilla CCMP1545]
MAVTVFFFITGYVVYIGYADKVNEPEFGYWTFIKKRYIRLVPMHWLAILAFAPIVYVNYATIRDDYYLWQNKSSEYHMWAGWILNPFFMHTWIFSSMHYWNAPMWSVSTQCGFYFLFPFLARRMLKKIDKEETHVAQVYTLVTAGPNAGRSAGVVAELDAKKIDRNYVTRARWLFFWSIVIPVCAMSFFMSETFKKEWADPDAPDTDPGALEEDFNIVRAYFNARSWPPFRLPVFMLGMLFAAKRVRAHRNGDAANPDYVGYIGQQTDSLGWKLALWCVVSSALSCAYEDQKINVRMFNEFFLTLAVAYFVYGITVAPNDSWIARVVLRNRVMTFLGGLTYAAYVMQFVVWIYVNVVKTSRRTPRCRRRGSTASSRTRARIGWTCS